MHPGLGDVVADARPQLNASPATEARFLMCPPLHYAVSCSMNPWMNLRATLASRGGSGCRGELRHRMRGLGAFQRKLLSPRHGALSFALRRRDLLPWRFKAGCAPS